KKKKIRLTKLKPRLVAGRYGSTGRLRVRQGRSVRYWFRHQGRPRPRQGAGPLRWREDDTMIVLPDDREPTSLDVAVAPEPAPTPAPDAQPRTPAPPGADAAPQAEAAPAAKKRGGGPRSEAGRNRSRFSSRVDGLRARVLVPEAIAALADERTEQLK